MGNEGKGGVGMFFNKKHKTWSVTHNGVSQVVGLSTEKQAKEMMAQIAQNVNRAKQTASK